MDEPNEELKKIAIDAWSRSSWMSMLRTCDPWIPIYEAITAERERAEKAEAIISASRTSALVLLQNAEACVREHHGVLFVEPGWLRDCRRDIEALSAAALSKEKAND